MAFERLRRLIRSAVSAALAGALAALAPNLASYEAAAQAFGGGRANPAGPGSGAERLRVSADEPFFSALPPLDIRRVLAAASAAADAKARQREAQIKAFVGARQDFIPKAEVDEFLRRTGFTMDELLLALLPFAKAVARPQVSHYPVGAVGLGLSGNIYFGGNLSFIGVPNAQGAHAEQSVVANAVAHGEVGLSALAVTDPPCGNCRQFLLELKAGAGLRVLTPQFPALTLGELLKYPYTRPSMDLLGPNDNGLALLPISVPADAPRDLIAAALAAANAVNSPYTCSGVALRTGDGRVFVGRYLDVTGGNPSLPPLQGALVSLAAAGAPYDQIVQAALVELDGARVVQEETTRDLLRVIAPAARFWAAKAAKKH